jgi:hypothetical protein
MSAFIFVGVFINQLVMCGMALAANKVFGISTLTVATQGETHEAIGDQVTAR